MRLEEVHGELIPRMHSSRSDGDGAIRVRKAWANLWGDLDPAAVTRHPITVLRSLPYLQEKRDRR